MGGTALWGGVSADFVVCDYSPPGNWMDQDSFDKNVLPRNTRANSRVRSSLAADSVSNSVQLLQLP